MVISERKSREIGRKIATLDRSFAEVVAAFAPSPIGTSRPRSSNFESLARSILAQQLSTKAARTISGRVAELAGGRLDSKKIEKLSLAKLRSAGCSNSKARSLLELSEAVNSGEIRIRELNRMSDLEIETVLLPLHGIGKWTIEMFLIFQLGRQDIWPVGDLGVRRGWEKIHRLDTEIKLPELSAKGSKFAPYRSHLAWYCWRAHDLYA